MSLSAAEDAALRAELAAGWARWGEAQRARRERIAALVHELKTVQRIRKAARG